MGMGIPTCRLDERLGGERMQNITIAIIKLGFHFNVINFIFIFVFLYPSTLPVAFITPEDSREVVDWTRMKERRC